MKILGHHVPLPAAVLAAIEGTLFLSGLYWLGFLGNCASCYFDGIANLEWHEALLVTALFVLISAASGLYNHESLIDFRYFVRHFILASQLVLIPTVLAVGFGKAALGLPFGWYLGVLSLAIGVFFLVIFLLRLALFWWFDAPFMKRAVVVYGRGRLADKVMQFIATDGTRHLRCVGQIGHGLGASGAGAGVRGNVALAPGARVEPVSLAALAQSLQADEIVLAVDELSGLPMAELLECRLRGIQVVRYLDFWEREAGQIDIEEVGDGWLATAEGFRVNLPRRIIKRIVDVVVSLVVLVLIAPVALVAAAAIKLESRGPVFYRQERVGLDGRIFTILKLRSMRLDAEKDGVPKWAKSGDDRTTRVGRFIRKTRLDEVPQVLNVLLGDMSFIGPRPERPYFVEQLNRLVPYYALRHRVRPGITGWAQVNYPYGASIEDAKKKLAYDLYYVKNNDTLLDIAILLQTVRVILFAAGGR